MIKQSQHKTFKLGSLLVKDYKELFFLTKLWKIQQKKVGQESTAKELAKKS